MSEAIQRPKNERQKNQESESQGNENQGTENQSIENQDFKIQGTENQRTKIQGTEIQRTEIQSAEAQGTENQGTRIQREETQRTEMLLGYDGVENLKNSKVAVFGVGGVGGYTAEALARSGVGSIDLYDSDRVSLSNINRQIAALHSTVGKYKADVMKERILDINSCAEVNAYKVFYLPENADKYPLDKYDYVVDAIDTVSAKIELICRCDRLGVPIISAMGAGNKLDPTAFKVADIYSTKMCPLAKVVRRELKSRDIKSLKVVYSEEKAKKPEINLSDSENSKPVPGSVSFVPSVAGLIIAGEVIKDLALRAKEEEYENS